ncbi:MAG: tRNA lysidine(34) synthetase TilS [Elusimicrobiaceae bacterium]|nr:tRNA lysidine(34) synthetase TilS [Elusimicrobiaceae bacterium]
MQSTSFQAKIWQKLIKFDRENKFFKTKQNVLIALSGGADSVALLHFACALGKKMQFKVYACHVNHNLRSTAKRDENLAINLCKELNVPIIVKKVAVKTLVKKEKLSLEHAARKLRYKAIENAAKEFNCKVIIFAHHADDNVETFLLNLLRGTQLKGLGGIPAKRPLGTLEIIRPFLCLSKQEILEYCKYHNLPYENDETNFDDIYTRNFIRLNLLPILEEKQPQIRKHILSLCSQVQKIFEEK